MTPPAREIFSSLLPCPLTLILKKKSPVPNILTGGSDNLGIRWSDYSLVQRLLDEYGFPLTATSANLAGASPLYSVSSLTEKFEDVSLSLIDLVIDAGPLPQRSPSTVLDLTSDQYKILRPGVISEAKIKAVLRFK